jgi:hypothetical protein
MIKHSQYLEITSHLKPISSGNSTRTWYKDFVVNNTLLRYSGLVDSEWVEVTALQSEENIYRGEIK